MRVNDIARSKIGFLALVGLLVVSACSGSSDSAPSTTATMSDTASSPAGGPPMSTVTVVPTTVIILSTTDDVASDQDLMPDVLCMDLQDAQNLIQDNGVFFSRSKDASGEGRRQIIDRNWIVVAQEPAAGSPIGERDPLLSVLKDDEVTDCG